MRRSPKFDCLIPSLLRPMSHPARKRTRARFGLTATHTGAHGVSHLVSSLADILEVLLRAGFVPSTPGTPELCSSAYTLQVALCAQSAIRNLSNACRSILDRSVQYTAPFDRIRIRITHLLKRNRSIPDATLVLRYTYLTNYVCLP